MKFDIFQVSGLYKKDDPIIIENIGYIEDEKFDKDKFWTLCNWSEYSDNKPENLFANIEACGSNIVFYNPEEEKYHIPDVVGWDEANDFVDVESIFCLRKVRLLGLKSGEMLSVITK